MKLLLVVGAVLAVLCPLAAAKPAPKVTHFLQLSVPGGDAEEANAVATIAEVEALVVFAKERKMQDNILMLLRSALQKVGKSVDDAKVKRERRERKKADKAQKEVELRELRAKEAPFTSGNTVVRPLKQSMHAPKCNVKRYGSPEELTVALRAGKVDLGSPFLVTGAATRENAAAKTFREGWTAEALKAMKDVGIQFMTPRLAKLAMEDGRESGQTMEVFQPQMITFDQYFQ